MQLYTTCAISAADETTATRRVLVSLPFRMKVQTRLRRGSLRAERGARAKSTYTAHQHVCVLCASRLRVADRGATAQYRVVARQYRDLYDKHTQKHAQDVDDDDYDYICDANIAFEKSSELC